MKNLLFILISFFCLNSYGQDLLTNEIDEFTGEEKKLTVEYNVAKGVSTLTAQVGKLNATYFIFLSSSSDLGCAGAVGNFVIFKFSDGSTIKLEDEASIDCGDYPRSLFIFNPADFEGKTVEKIRLKQSKYYDDCDWDNTLCKYTFLQLIEAVK